MHAEDAHAKQGGFFSKIFGHHDDPANQVEAGSTADPNVIHPEDAAAAGVADLATAAVADIEPVNNSEATATPEPTAVADTIIGNSTMSDVHAIPKGEHEPVDLTSSDTAPKVELAEASTEPIVVADEPTPTLETTSLEGQTPIADEPDSGAAPAETMVVSDSDMQALRDAQAAHAANAAQKTEADSSDLTSDEAPAAEDLTEPVSSEASALNDVDNNGDSFEIPTPPPTAYDGDTSLEPTSPVVDEPVEAAEVADKPANTDDSPSIDIAPSDLDVVPPSAPEPPSPPVEEGQAWQSEQADAKATDQAPLVEDVTPIEASVAASDEKTAEVASEVSDILSTRGEYVTDTDNKDVPTANVVEKSEPVKDHPEANVEAIAPVAAETKSEDSGETQAALARLEQHIDELDTGLQKVRSELAGLKSRLTS